MLSPCRRCDHLPARGRGPIALPLLAYFVIMFAGSFVLGRAIGPELPKDVDAVLHPDRQQLRAGHRGGHRHVRRDLRASPGWGSSAPLIEVPVLVALVYVALWAGRRFFPGDPTVPVRAFALIPSCSPRSLTPSAEEDPAHEHHPTAALALRAPKLLLTRRSPNCQSSSSAPARSAWPPRRTCSRTA